MAFDWFRRRYVQEEQTPDQAVPQETSPPELDPAAELDPQSDYLAFAKAAYANIKARQAAAEPQPANEPEPESLEVEPTDDPQLSDSTPPVPFGAQNLTEKTETRDPVDDLLDSLTLEDTEGGEAQLDHDLLEAVDPAISEPNPPVTEPDAEGSQPTPSTAFFDLAPRASQRLEALEATAVEEPATLPVAVTTTQQEPPEQLAGIPGLTFDEGFRWSAELLAAQGRKAEDISVEEITWLQKLRQGLGKTRLSLINQLKALVGRGPIDQDAVDEIETVLLQADVGVDACDKIISALQTRMRKETLPPDEAVRYLKSQMREMLTLGDPMFAPERDTLNIWLIVGVNGAGKTTTIGKLAHIASQSGYDCLVAAGDTFRAAAVEQLKVWGERAGVEVIANPGQNTDPAAVVFDAVNAAQSRQTELLLVDTAGRLQNKKNLMDELTKIRRIIDKKAPHAKIESLLVLDATQGQNGLRQAQVFAEAAQISGVVLTKLDSTAKGGIAFAITQQLGLPIRFIGAGEGIEDLRPFSSYEFVEALVSEY
ncbi:MAG: signal recognition particle-docking protein FtsY [Synechococcaceae cyanobacterium SM2_3_2]|nr:signal recognition particle-docking protein FtsY [Synechococcaceae cyanobacterium SM2_3_2]